MAHSSDISDFVLKVIMVGDSGVGKSCLLKSFMGDPFEQGYTSTIGVDFEIKPVIIDGKTVNLQIWDTAGQERFRTITTSYYRSADAILLVFDVTEKSSFKNLEVWMEDIRSYAKPNVDIMLIGNKIDVDKPRAVDFQTAKQYADDNHFLYIETSAKKLVNVEKAFLSLTAAAVSRRLGPKTSSAGDKPPLTVGADTKKDGDSQCAC